jgi:hypothetical protein
MRRVSAPAVPSRRSRGRRSRRAPGARPGNTAKRGGAGRARHARRGRWSRSAPGPMRPWLCEDKITPWRSPAWPPATAPQGGAQAPPGLDLDHHAPAVAAQGEAVVCREEKTSSQARQRVSAPKVAAPGGPLHVAAREKRMGAGPRFWAWLVASGRPCARTRRGRQGADCQACLLAWLQSARGTGLQGVHLRRAHGSTPAPTPLGAWRVSLAWACAVRIDWVPTPASGLDQGAILCSKGPRAVLTPNDGPRTLALEPHLQRSWAARNGHPQPMPWTDTKTKLMAQCGTPQPTERAA